MRIVGVGLATKFPAARQPAASASVRARTVLRALSLWPLLLAVLAAPLAASAQSPEVERGRALYEARCQGCHETSVHRRESRAARDFAQLRAAVVRWDREIGALWRPEEIDAVTAFLNERYYRYPCPSTVCSAARAVQRTGMVRTVPD